MTSTRFAAAVFDGPPVMLMTRADRPVPPTGRFERDARVGLDRARQALRELPEDLGFAVHLADVDGFSYTEIAEITGTSIVTVRTRLRDARRSLRHRLSPIPERRP